MRCVCEATVMELGKKVRLPLELIGHSVAGYFCFAFSALH